MNRDEMLQTWRQEAKQWILEEATRFLTDAHSQSPTSNPEITVGQIVTYLDRLPPVPGYEILRTENSLRYQVVRTVVEGAARAGTFDVGSTTNSRGRESKCFSPAGWRPSRRPRRTSFNVEVDAPNAADVEKRLQAWLAENDVNLTSLYVERTDK